MLRSFQFSSRSLLTRQCPAKRYLSVNSSTLVNGKTFQVDNPYDGSTYAQVPVHDLSFAMRAADKAQQTFLSWRSSPLKERVALVNKFMEEFANSKEQIARDITGQMGKPLKQARSEVDTAIARAKALIELAPQALAPESLSAPSGLLKQIEKEPIGPVLCLSPWNYPLLCAVNTVVTAVLSGCPVLLKHSDRTPLCSVHFEQAFQRAGAPSGLVQALQLTHDDVGSLMGSPNVAYVSFTGSVAGGRQVYQTAAKRFIDVGLELGGKDPAYVASDADVAKAADGLVDGAMYNAGQSCCSVERVYVHASRYDDFVQQSRDLIAQYVLGDPRAEATTMGPVAQKNQSQFILNQIDEAKRKGAVIASQPVLLPPKGRFVAPTLLANCNHNMAVMTEETFGPVMAVMRVENDEQAVKLMNDSKYGLTAAVFTADQERAFRIGRQLETGTVFMNRCDFLDPYLPWSGRKDSGKGVGLSHLGFAPFVRTKSFNLRVSN